MPTPDDEKKRANYILDEMYRAHKAAHGGDGKPGMPFLFHAMEHFAERLARAETEPQGIELVKQLRDTLGLDNYARPDSPSTVWDETLEHVRILHDERDKWMQRTKQAHEDGNTEIGSLRVSAKAHARRALEAEAEL